MPGRSKGRDAAARNNKPFKKVGDHRLRDWQNELGGQSGAALSDEFEAYDRNDEILHRNASGHELGWEGPEDPPEGREFQGAPRRRD